MKKIKGAAAMRANNDRTTRKAPTNHTHGLEAYALRDYLQLRQITTTALERHTEQQRTKNDR